MATLQMTIMNWRLVSDEQKAHAKCRKYRMKSARAKMRRREAQIRVISDMLKNLTDLDEVVGSGEALGTLSRTSHKTSILIRLLRLRLLRFPSEMSDHSEVPIRKMEMTKKIHILRRRRRSAVSPDILPHEMDLSTKGLSFQEFRALAQKSYSENASVYRLIDLGRAFTDGDWDKGAELIMNLNLTPRPITVRDIADARSAREFWELWQDGADIYKRAVQIGALLPAGGANSAWFEHASLLALLPGIKLPPRHYRLGYIVDMEEGGSASNLNLIIRGPSGNPLTVHPLE